MENVSVLFAIGSSIATTVFIAGGFYVLTTWRLNKLEEQHKEHSDVRDRLITMEAKIDMLLNKEQ